MPFADGLYSVYVIAGNLWYNCIVVFYLLFNMDLGQEASEDNHQ